MMIFYVFVVFLALYGPADSAPRKLPPFIKACSRSDPQINKCVVEHGNEAIPKLKNGDKKYKIPSFDPLKVDAVTLQPGANLKLALKNLDVWGLDKIKIKDADLSVKNNYIKLYLTAPQVQLVGDYDIDGKILILPIVGKGKSNITYDNLDVTYQLNFKSEEQNGVQLFKIIDNTVDYSASRIYFGFDNLFNGDQRLGKEMSKFLDENWQNIDKEIHGSFNEVIASIIKNLMQQISEGILFDDVILP